MLDGGGLGEDRNADVHCARTSFRAAARNLPKYEAETIFPDPWPGGWWHLRQIVDMQKVAAWAALDIAARNRETVLWNAYQKAIHQTQRGAEAPLNEYVIPAHQHDPITANFLVQKLLVQGIDIQKAEKPFITADGHAYDAGTFVISARTAQDGPHPQPA